MSINYMAKIKKNLTPGNISFLEDFNAFFMAVSV
jgi:hypothetical protein